MEFLRKIEAAHSAALVTNARDFSGRVEVSEASALPADYAHNDMGGYGNVANLRRRNNYQRSFLALNRLLTEARNGSARAEYLLKEGMTTSDFPYLMGDNLYRQMLGQYQVYQPTYPNYVAIEEVKDFRKVNLLTLDGGTGVMPPVEERAPYPELKFKDGRYQVQVGKFGNRIPLTFEMLVNDDMNAFMRLPMLAGQGARFTEENFATSLFVDLNGPTATVGANGNPFYGVANKNKVTSNPALSIPALQTAFTQLAAQVNSDGQPIVITAVELVVPPALMITAENILNATELWLNASGGDATTQVHTVNWMRQRTRLSINPFIPLQATTTNGNTSWFLFASAQTAVRPALQMVFLRGRRQPQMFVKNPTQTMVGGGSSDPMEGDFESDAIDYKIRHFMGGTTVDPKMTVASNGSGS